MQHKTLHKKEEKNKTLKARVTGFRHLHEKYPLFHKKLRFERRTIKICDIYFYFFSNHLTMYIYLFTF